jgi:hypothetical protein
VLVDWVVQVCEQGGVALLLACLKLGSPQTFENATGALWNVGCHPRSAPFLVASGAPEYLAHPVPADWLVSLSGCLFVCLFV